MGRKKERRYTYKQWEKLAGQKPKANRKYKDTVFRMLFSDKAELLSLCNAVNGTNYTDVNELEITTLENAIYMNIKNDLACVIDMNLYLWEHQSTINPNIPLRDLDYGAKSFERYKVGKDIYSSVQIKLPNPKFIVFYNGEEEQPEKKVYRLSDAFMHEEPNPSLELVVTQININKGYNEDLLKKCPTLREYMLYVDTVRTYRKSMSLDEAVNKAVDECIKNGILAEFLKRNKSEVVSTSIFEYDQELHERTMKEIYTEKGIEIGRKAGLREGEAKGRKSGLAEGLRKGEAKGRKAGLREGEIYTMFKRMHMPVEEISKELGLDVEYVKGVIDTI